MIRLILFSLLFATTSASAAPLDDAIAIVISESARVAEKETALQWTEREPEWKTKLRFTGAYSDKETQEYAGGFDQKAQLTFEIPLFSTEKRKAVAGAKEDVRVAEESSIAKFLSDVADLVLLQRKIETARRFHQLKLDKLQYFTHAEEQCRELEAAAPPGEKPECIIQSHQLWPIAEEAKTAENDIFLALEQYK
ncbi:MAG TPA: hypothetical protein VLA51_00355, partial [Paracoccaceae bacterium]|nr:hypothetical protein [Paracoccaceae bacterium]